MTRNRASRKPRAGVDPAAVPAIAPPGRRTAAAFSAALFAAGLLAALAPAQAGAQPSDVTRKKLVRQIGVMESIIDQVLVDSPNFFVQSTNDNTRGIYLEEFGVLFSFQASLVSKDWNVENFKMPKFHTDGDKIIIDLDDKEREKLEKEMEKQERERERLERERGEHSEHPEPDEDEEAPEADEDGEFHWQKESVLLRQEKTYKRGKTEILETLLDYGDTMTGLRDEQSIGIVGSLRDSEFFNDRRISRVLFRVKMRDIRAYTAGQLTEAQAKAKVSEEEY